MSPDEFCCRRNRLGILHFGLANDNTDKTPWFVDIDSVILFSTDDSHDNDLNCTGIHEVISHFNTQITGSRTRTSGFQIFP